MRRNLKNKKAYAAHGIPAGRHAKVQFDKKKTITGMPCYINPPKNNELRPKFLKIPFFQK